MSFIDNLKNIEVKIYENIIKNVEKIKNGYEVIKYEINDHDIYACSKIECRNGYKGTIWEIEKPLNRDLNEYRKSLKSNGFLFNNIYFFINIDKLDMNNLNISQIEVILVNKINT